MVSSYVLTPLKWPKSWLRQLCPLNTGTNRAGGTGLFQITHPFKVGVRRESAVFRGFGTVNAQLMPVQCPKSPGKGRSKPPNTCRY
jgi:hypothetical protein